MIPPLKPGAKLLKVDGPVIETARLILRPWRSSDIAANTAMLSDPGTARYITPDGIAITTEIGGWRNAAVISGHWALHGFGMFAVEEKSSRPLCRPRRAVVPAGWTGLRSAGASISACRGRGYAVEAARASIDWVFVTFEIEEIIHCMEFSNEPSKSVARRLGARRDGDVDLSGKTNERWVTSRATWKG